MRFPGRLYLLFTPDSCRRDPWQTLELAIAGGVDLVQWRKKSEDRTGFERCRTICRAHNVPLIVNDDVMLAVRGRAAGGHVGQTDMPIPAARKVLVDRWLGVSTHDGKQIAEAAHEGADYIGFGPCHPTATKGYEHGKSPADIEAAVAAAAQHRVPLFAIGGINPGNLPGLRMLGVDRIAVSSHVLSAEDPKAAAAALRAFL